jgi:hypothetical protein
VTVAPHIPEEVRAMAAEHRAKEAERAVAVTFTDGPDLSALLAESLVSAITSDTPAGEVAGRLEALKRLLGSLPAAHRAIAERIAGDTLANAGWPAPWRLVERALANPGTVAEAPGSPPALEAAALYGPLGDWVRAVAPATEANAAALLASGLVAVGCLIGRSPFCTLDGARHGTNLNVLLIGPTNAGRKGTAATHARRLLREIDPEFSRSNVMPGLSTGEGLVNVIRDARPADAAGKGGDPGVTDKRALFVEGEFSSVLRVQRREGNTLSATLRECWDGWTLRNVTKGNPQTATDPHVAILGMITPAELRRHLDDCDFESGYLNRFILVWAERSQLLPFGATPDDGAALAHLERAVVTARQRTDLSDLTPAARAWWADAYPGLTSGAPGRVGAACQRAAPQVRRVALLFAALDGARAVDLCHLEAAGALWRYAAATAAYVFGGARALSARAQRLEAALLDAGPAGLDRKAAREALGSHNVPATALTAALGELQEAGTARSEADTLTGGRAREVWRHVRHLAPPLNLLGRNGHYGQKERDTAHKAHNALAAPGEGASERCADCGGVNLTWWGGRLRCEDCRRPGPRAA